MEFGLLSSITCIPHIVHDRGRGGEGGGKEGEGGEGREEGGKGREEL